jgi:hypothetical protein
MAFLMFAILCGWSGAQSLLVAPLLVGAFVALCLPDGRVAATVAGCAGVLAAGASVLAYAMPALVVRAHPTPSTADLFTAVGEIAGRSLLNALPSALGITATLLSGAATALVAWGVARAMARSSRDPATIRARLASAVVLALCASYALTAVGGSARFMQTVRKEPVPGAYAYDASVYLKTYYEMLRGNGFYESLVDAASGDKRVIADPATGIRDGKSYGGWLWGPSAIRRPTIFYFWRWLAPWGADGVVYWAVLVSAVALWVVWWGLVPHLGHRAVFVPVFAMPYALFMTLGLNIFFPDYWATLVVVCALALIMRQRWIPGTAALLLAAAIRETVGPTLVVLAFAMLVGWLREGRGREWLVRAGTFVGAAAVWLGFERVHEMLGARFMAVPYPSSPSFLLALARTRTFFDKVISPTQYLMFPYGFYKVPGLAFLIAAPVGFRAFLAPDRAVRFTVVSYSLFWIAFLFALGASSPYWGQAVMLPSIVGVGGLLACADRLDRRLELREPIA